MPNSMAVRKLDVTRHGLFHHKDLDLPKILIFIQWALHRLAPHPPPPLVTLSLIELALGQLKIPRHLTTRMENNGGWHR